MLEPIPQMDPGAGYRAQAVAIDAAVARVLASGWYVLGPEVAAFEAAFAEQFGLGHAVGVASGTDALTLALHALGVGPGDRVATVAHTAVATVAAIELAGAEPVLVDIDPGAMTLDPVALERTLDASPGIRAVVPVHLYGLPADMPAIVAIARRHGVLIVEDCAQAHGARIGDQAVGSFGDAAAFSFYPTKNLGCFGDGGLVTTQDPSLAQRLRELREYGWRVRYVSETRGFNSRLDELQAAILAARLPHLETGNARRRAIAERYRSALRDVGVRFQTLRSGAVSAAHQFVIAHPQRDEILDRLRQAGVGVGIHYPVPVHRQPAYEGRVAQGAGGLAATERAAHEVLSLPLYPELSDQAVERVIRVLIEVLADLAPEPDTERARV
jgi:dTDP-4-amino-4,6-dideoxygalactose transaminase